MLSEPATGNSNRRQGAPPTGYSRIPIRSVSRMNATTASPVTAPITSANTRKICPSRCRNSATRSNSQLFHRLPLVVSTSSLISGKLSHQEHTSRDHLLELAWRGSGLGQHCQCCPVHDRWVVTQFDV